MEFLWILRANTEKLEKQNNKIIKIHLFGRLKAIVP